MLKMQLRVRKLAYNLLHPQFMGLFGIYFKQNLKKYTKYWKTFSKYHKIWHTINQKWYLYPKGSHLISFCLSCHLPLYHLLQNMLKNKYEAAILLGWGKKLVLLRISLSSKTYPKDRDKVLTAIIQWMCIHYDKWIRNFEDPII